MSYQSRFEPLDRLIDHMDTVVPVLPDPYLKSQYIGYLCISVVTIYELCIKDIFIGFAEKKHRAFGDYCGSVFEKMNGRVSLKDLKEMHVPKFGEKYVKKLVREIDNGEVQGLMEERMSIKSSYGNVVVWRNKFAHEGILPPNASYTETCIGYRAGKKILACLARAMVR